MPRIAYSMGSSVDAYPSGQRRRDEERHTDADSAGMETQTRSRVTREEWAKRVERWRDSGLKCAEFAAEVGVNPRTLTYWKWILGKEARREKRAWPGQKRHKQRAPRETAGGASTNTQAVMSGLVEVHAVAMDGRFELELGAVSVIAGSRVQSVKAAAA